MRVSGSRKAVHCLKGQPHSIVVLAFLAHLMRCVEASRIPGHQVLLEAQTNDLGHKALEHKTSEDHLSHATDHLNQTLKQHSGRLARFSVNKQNMTLQRRQEGLQPLPLELMATGQFQANEVKPAVQAVTLEPVNWGSRGSKAQPDGGDRRLESMVPEGDWISQASMDVGDSYRPVMVPKSSWATPRSVSEPPPGAPKVNHSLRHGTRSGLARWLPPVTWELLLNIGSGTGAAPGSTGDLILDQDLMQRMRFQDKVVMILLMLAYAGSLAFSASLAYRQSINNSPVTFYADPRYYTQVTESNEIEDFLEAFNNPPKDVQLQITGFVPLPPLHESFIDAAVDWLGSRYRIAFSFALDLSPWIVQDTEQTGAGVAGGIQHEDLDNLREFLECDGNDLATVEVHKVVHWKDWEELAVNVKHQIRQGGFNGVLRVTCAEDEIMTVYKNRTWANFMHRRATKVLCALSLFGWLIYHPYMWFRQTALVVTAHYRVDVAITNYWPLICDKVGPDGFTSG